MSTVMKVFERIYKSGFAVAFFSVALALLALGAILSGHTFSEERALKWIGALTGFVAALAALATILLLDHQIKKNEDTAHRHENEAREVFDREIAETLQNINEFWKHAEDILREEKRGNDIEKFTEAFKRRITATHRNFEQRNPADLCSQMHPIDASGRRELVERIKSSTSKVMLYDIYEDGEVVEREAGGFEYFRDLVNRFIYLEGMLARISLDLADIFAARDKKRTDRTQPEDLTEIRRHLLSRFPDDPSNPY